MIIKLLLKMNWGGNMLSKRDKNELDRKIEKIAKKLNVFTYNDIETLIGAKNIDIVNSLEFLLVNKVIKKMKDGFVYVSKFKPQNEQFQKSETIEVIEDVKCNRPRDVELEILINHLTPTTTEPKEIFIKHFKDLQGYIDFFFSSVEAREKILRLVWLLKCSREMTKSELDDMCKQIHILPRDIYEASINLPKYGFGFYLRNEPICEPIEIYLYFKEFYLTPACLTARQARKMAISKFEDLVDAEFFHYAFKPPFHYLKRLLNEYTKQEIRTFRTANFSKFNLEELEFETG